MTVLLSRNELVKNLEWRLWAPIQNWIDPMSLTLQHVHTRARTYAHSRHDGRPFSLLHVTLLPVLWVSLDLAADVPGKIMEEEPSAGAPARVGDPVGALGSTLHSGLAPAIAAACRVKQ